MNLTVSTPSLAVAIDSDTGRLVSVRNLVRDLELISTPPSSPPFRLQLTGSAWVDDFVSFSYQSMANGLRLVWETAVGVTLISDVTTRGQDILMTVAARNHGKGTIEYIEYPIIANIGRLAGAGQDELVHSHATGMLFRDPVDLFEDDPHNHRRLRPSIYPEGFSGSTMQMMAYYGRGKGGFYFGTEDSKSALKGYNFYKAWRSLHASIMHKAAVFAAGTDYAPDYPVVLAALTEGTWYEAANRYKKWAVTQNWAQPTQRSQWLFEKVGICTFGINARYDRTPWLDELHRIAGVPIFHILGPNWANYGQDYRNHLPRGKSDWFPALFSDANLAAIRRNGDYWGPFEFDLLCNHSRDLPDPVLESRVVRSTLAGWDHSFPYMCAGTDYWHDLHVWRDMSLVKEHGCDALYYDISISNLMMMECRATNHNHPPGSGTVILDEFIDMYKQTQAAMNAAKGAYVPMGTEVIIENLNGVLDFYQARAEGDPLAPFETNVFRDWIVKGKAEKIPLFTYVYHENGPQRMDGWAKLAKEAGDLFYWTAARILLNGGLLEINNEFSGLEDLGDLKDNPAEHYWDFVPRPYTIDPGKAAFVGEVARTRVGPANPFLAHGTMLPAPTIEAPNVDMDYFFYAISPGPTYEERGSMNVPSVLATAWQYNNRTAWLLANITAQEQHIHADGKAMTIPPRRIVMVEP